MAANIADISAYAMRALAWQGAPKKGGSSKKFALTTAATLIILPLDAHGRPPSMMRITLPSGAKVYADISGELAVTPTTSAYGTTELRDGDVISLWGADRISLVAEASGTVTLSYLWI